MEAYPDVTASILAEAPGSLSGLPCNLRDGEGTADAAVRPPKSPPNTRHSAAFHGEVHCRPTALEWKIGCSVTPFSGGMACDGLFGVHNIGQSALSGDMSRTGTRDASGTPHRSAVGAVSSLRLPP